MHLNDLLHQLGQELDEGSLGKDHTLGRTSTR